MNNEICGRDQAKLDEARKDAIATDYGFIAYVACMADMADSDHLTNALVTDHGGADFLINNAGRLIRRAVEAR